MKNILLIPILLLTLASCKKNDNKTSDPQKVGDYFDVPNWRDAKLIGKRKDGNGYDTINAMLVDVSMENRNYSNIQYQGEWYYVAAYNTQANTLPAQKEYHAHLFVDGDYTNGQKFGGETTVTPRLYMDNSGTLQPQPQSIRADFPPFNTNVQGGYYVSE